MRETRTSSPTSIPMHQEFATVAIPRPVYDRLRNACRASGVSVSEVITGSLTVAADNLEWLREHAQAEPECVACG